MQSFYHHTGWEKMYTALCATVVVLSWNGMKHVPLFFFNSMLRCVCVQSAAISLKIQRNDLISFSIWVNDSTIFLIQFELQYWTTTHRRNNNHFFGNIMRFWREPEFVFDLMHSKWSLNIKFYHKWRVWRNVQNSQQNEHWVLWIVENSRLMTTCSFRC